MKDTYTKIVSLMKKIGINSTFDYRKLKVIDLSKTILMYEPTTGWLALRNEISYTNANETRKVHYNKPLYDSKDKPVKECTKEKLKELYNQILS